MQRIALAVMAGALLVSAGGGDQAPAPARVAALRAAALPSPVALPRFVLFGWVSPPADFESADRYAEMAAAGFNLSVLAWEDSGSVSANRRRLDWTRPLGMKNLLLDQELDKIDFGDASTLRWADTVTARYRDDAAFLGYYLGDEPGPARFSQLAKWFAALRERDPAHPAWNNLNGRGWFGPRVEFESYVRQYVETVHPAVLCDDHYDFLVNGDANQLVENIASLAAIAREYGLPFWGIVQLVQHTDHRAITEGVFRWQMAQWLSYGARGIGTFTYWTPAPDPDLDWHDAMIQWGTGARTPFYGMVREANRHAAAVGVELAGMQWLATEHAGSVPPGGTPFAPDSVIEQVQGRATLGMFADSLGRAHVLVGNADSLAARTLTITLAGEGRRAWRLRDDGAWEELAVSAARRLDLALAPGDFALLRLSGALDSLAAGRSLLRLDAGPNPARARVTFAVGGMASGARLEVLDLSGRRVWGRTFASGGSAAAAWSGERDGGGVARAGVYFARLEDRHGVVVRRVNWLGAR